MKKYRKDTFNVMTSQDTDPRARVTSRRILTHNTQSGRVASAFAFSIGSQARVVACRMPGDALQYQTVVTQNYPHSHIVVNFVTL
jgi:hypothetical protein